MRAHQIIPLLSALSLGSKAQHHDDPIPLEHLNGTCQSPPDPWAPFHLVTQCPAPPEDVLPPKLEPVEANTSTVDGFVSFEDWKKIKLAETEQENTTIEDTDEKGEANETEVNGTVLNDDQPLASAAPSIAASKGRPHSQILSYNFASPDCSARIHSSSPQSQHASSVLHKSRDRYMLTPCKADQHWVIVELCDEIRVEAIEISMWEFFSGIVREVQLSGGNDDEEFSSIGSFTTRNARGSQTFFLPTATPFHRFLRLDFPSFYGTEYYCPISQVKVFGMNQMDAFKWEQKKGSPKPLSGESKRVEEEKAIQMPKLQVNLSTDGSLEDLLAQSNATLSESLTPSASSESAAPTAPSGESIYALIVRRLSALEGNTTLIASYIAEQSGMMMSKVDRKWTEWREQKDLDDVVERMRQEDRLGMIISQLEQQRVWIASTDAQLRRLTDELTFERRRGFAQIFIMVVAIILVVTTRSNPVQRLLRPLADFSEDKRFANRPMTTPTKTSAPVRPTRRPHTPPLALGSLRRRHVSSSFRSFSENVERSRTSMPPRSPRHLGRNAHLHTLAPVKSRTPTDDITHSADEVSEMADSASDGGDHMDELSPISSASPGLAGVLGESPKDVKYA